MKTNYQYDNLGNIDTDYYVEKAYELRRAYLAQGFKKIAVSLKKAVAGLLPTRSVQGHTAH